MIIEYLRSKGADTTVLKGQYVTMHALRPFQGVNLNADDKGNPKRAMFAGHWRTVVSRQSRKRALREWMQLASGSDDFRSRALPAVVAEHLVSNMDGWSIDEALYHTAGLLIGCDFNINSDSIQITEEQVFAPKNIIADIAVIVDKNRNVLTDAANTVDKEKITDPEAKKKAKKISVAKLPKELVAQVKDLFKSGTNPEVALNGRLLTVLPEEDKKLISALQVNQSYTIGSEKKNRETFTVKDDLTDSVSFLGTADKDPMITASGVLYERAVFDRSQMAINLTNSLTPEDDLTRMELLSVQATRWAPPAARSAAKGNTGAPAFWVATVSDYAPLAADVCWENPIDDGPGSEIGAKKLITWLTKNQKYGMYSGGYACWMGLDDLDVDLPEGFTWV